MTKVTIHFIKESKQGSKLSGVFDFKNGFKNETAGTEDEAINIAMDKLIQSNTNHQIIHSEVQKISNYGWMVTLISEDLVIS